MNFKGLIIIIIGTLFFIFRKSLAELAVKQQNEYFKANYSQRDVKGNQIVFTIVAIGAIFLGIIVLFKIRFR